MRNNEQDIIQKLKDRSSDVNVPDSLNPETLTHVLEEKCKRKKKVSPQRIGLLAAACLVLVCGAAVWRTGHVEKGAQLQTSGRQLVKEAGDYAEVYACFEKWQQENKISAAKGMVNELGTDMAKMASAESADTAENSEYSETNVRQDGVDEGDVVKTDGRYLYVLGNDRTGISVVDTKGAELKAVSCIEVEEALWIHEMYLDASGKKLIAVCSRQQGGIAKMADGYSSGSGTVEAITFDITDPENPEERGRVTQSGNYHSSRMSEGYLYVFSDYYVAGDAIERENPKTYIPLVNGELVAEKDICLPPDKQAGCYMIATAVCTDTPDKVNDSRAVLSQGGELYVSSHNIYYYEYEWDYTGLKEEQTTIRRIGYENGTFRSGSQTAVKGSIHDSFCIDEYRDYLRIVVTQGDTNAVYVLNMDLEVKGAIEGLAKDERVYSARLMGDTGYFVTFRETDPLFSVDFSSPENPQITGALKIPGFSDYLHPYGEGKLLGIGMDADEQDGTTGGVKLSMFDISNPADVKEEDTCVLENVFSTDVFYDYKAALVDADKNIIGFAGHMNGSQKYYIFEYDETEGFQCRLEEEMNGNASRAARGVYIDQMLYVIQGNVIEAYSLSDYKKADDLIL